MKKLLAILVLVLFGTLSFAQTNIFPPSGSVGIGTTAPAYPLHMNTAAIAGFVAQSSVAPADADRAVGYFRMINGANSDNYNIAYRKLGGVYQCLQSAQVAGATVNISLFNYATKELRFGGNGVPGVNGLGTISFMAGNVGIGTTSPQAKLSVNGTGTFNGKVKCTEVEVLLAAWPDYVFESGYNLRPLSEVENFINVNKHLPDVPSAATVTANGANLGEMNATLLQKVEELTLYMIQLQKDNDALKARVSNLEK
jgi:hypothetical protein